MSEENKHRTRIPKVFITDQRIEYKDLKDMKLEPRKGPRIPKKNFWDKLKTTVRGDNKLGQGLGVFKDVVLSFTPFGDRINKATGHISDALEAANQGKKTSDINLSQKQILILRIVGLVLVVLAVAVGLLPKEQLAELLQLILN